MSGGKKRGGGMGRPVNSGPVAPPEGAHCWALWLAKDRHHKNVDDGRIKTTTSWQRCKGDPDPNTGQVPDVFLSRDFSLPLLRTRWGAGKYRVQWYDKEGQTLSSQIFDLETPAAVAAAPSVPMGSGAPAVDFSNPFDVWSFFRAEGDRAIARDREMYGQFFSLLRDSIKAPAQPAAPALDASMILRQVQTLLGEERLEIKKLLATHAAETAVEPDDDDDDDEDEKPPRNMKEAGQRFAMRLLGVLEQKAPHLIDELVPKLTEWIQQSGVNITPSDLGLGSSTTNGSLTDALRKAGPYAPERR